MAKKNYEEASKAIIDSVGGKENVSYFTHCVTRLRFNLKDKSKVDEESLKKVEGILGVKWVGEQLQVIVGADVEEAYRTICKNYGFKAEEAIAENLDALPKKKFSISTVFAFLSEIIAPVIPVFCAAGMMKVVLLLLSSFGIVTGEEATYAVFDFISDVGFYFLPILIAMSTGKKFKVDQGLAICVGAALLYPTFVNAVSEGAGMSIFGIDIPMYSYSQTIFPAMFGVILLSYVHKLLNKIIKNNIMNTMLVPALDLAITTPLVLLFIAPLANWLANGLVVAFTFLLDTIGPFAGLIIGLLMPFMTLTGLHQSLSPLELMEMTNVGYSLVLTIELFHNFAEAGAAIGTSFAAKNKRKKEIAMQTGIQAFVGLSEPALYSVMATNKYSMAAAMIANGVGGFLGFLLGVKGYAFVWPNVFSLPTFITPGLTSSIIALAISVIATFVVGFILPVVFAKMGLTNYDEE